MTSPYRLKDDEEYKPFKEPLTAKIINIMTNTTNKLISINWENLIINMFWFGLFFSMATGIGILFYQFRSVPIKYCYTDHNNRDSSHNEQIVVKGSREWQSDVTIASFDVTDKTDRDAVLDKANDIKEHHCK